ncbi:DegT/DnrJ/EryC1/StrS family aminotransferase [Rhodococcoides fascians]|uniref:DegT/DnrJ/EryC1/StrS family aminotransferase n=1 Tax=Rhodococcoides fascians TaxID=1828 RepID=UPI002ACE6263|nr:DegT/DnrJ/EryC1/StrS family aminotransferase [Rhodococcus fascians]WQH28758.1 DegT/DnrJ/EryC1/StrS family aminotransferase [Rhodococcus fascians]
MTNQDELKFLTQALLDPDTSGKSRLVSEYEQALATEFGATNAVALNSGSAAIESALWGLGIRSGDEVLVSAAAPLPTLMPLIAAGTELIFVDCGSDSPGMDPADLKRKLSVHPGASAGVEVALWGYPLPHQAEVREILSTRGIPLIEDAAHAHGATVEGAAVGTLATVGCFSTHRMKMLSTGEGGFALTADAELADRIRRYSRISNLDGVDIGRNFKPSAFTAAIGLARLPGLTGVVHERRERASNLRAALPDALRREPAFVGEPNYYNLVVLVDDPERARSFHRKLSELGITTDPIRFRYKPATEHAITQRWAQYCPNADQLTTAAVQLPVDTSRDESMTAELVCRAWSA